MSYREMDADGQYNIDCRLDAERDLDENVSVVIEFAHQQHKAAVGENYVKNRHEGYGLLVERFAALGAAVKQVGNDMQTFQKILPVDDFRAIDASASIDNSLTTVITAALEMIAEAKRVGDDLYSHAPKTPMEEYADSLSEGDGFEEAGEPDPDAEDPIEEDPKGDE